MKYKYRKMKQLDRCSDNTREHITNTFRRHLFINICEAFIYAPEEVDDQSGLGNRKRSVNIGEKLFH